MSTFANPPASREELIARLDDLQSQGVVDMTEVSRLLAHYDDLQREMDEEKARLEPEYNARVEKDGKDAADAWLHEIAFDLGRRHGEATRRVTDQLRVVTG
jgi:hypothetical protein